MCVLCDLGHGSKLGHAHLLCTALRCGVKAAAAYAARAAAAAAGAAGPPDPAEAELMFFQSSALLKPAHVGREKPWCEAIPPVVLPRSAIWNPTQTAPTLNRLLGLI